MLEKSNDFNSNLFMNLLDSLLIKTRHNGDLPLRTLIKLLCLFLEKQ